MLDNTENYGCGCADGWGDFEGLGSGYGSGFQHSENFSYIFTDIRWSGYGEPHGVGYGIGDSSGNGDVWGRHELTLKLIEESEGKGYGQDDTR